MTRKFVVLESKVGLPDYTTVALKEWVTVDALPTASHDTTANGKPSSDAKRSEHVRVLCLHGWLDSAASWDVLAPLLLRRIDERLGQSVRIVAFDFLGHGLSSHRAKDSWYAVAERCVEVAHVVRHLQWESFVLVGHSMGAAVSTLYAGAMPEQVRSLVLVDGIGPYYPDPQLTAPQVLRKALATRAKVLSRHRNLYPNLETALQKYIKNNPSISREAATILVQRATQRVYLSDENHAEHRHNAAHHTSNQPSTGHAVVATPAHPRRANAEAVCFRHDPLLTGPSLVRITERESIEFMRAIQCATLVLLADNEQRRAMARKQPASPVKVAFERRIGALRNGTVVKIEGHHHIHLDSATECADAILAHLRRSLASTASRAKL